MATKTTKKETAPKAAEAVKETKAAETAAVAAPKAEKAAKVNLVLEYKGVQVTEAAIVKAVKAACKGTTVKTLDIYVKPEDAAAYYVANGDVTGKVSL